MNDLPVRLSKEELERFEPTAKMLAANGVAQSLSFTAERKYLSVVTADSAVLHLEVPKYHRIDSPAAPFWIKINQVGHPLEDSPERCFTAIQKILTSCFIPHKTQLIFIVRSENGVYEMHLGVRSLDKTEIDYTFASNLANFIEGVWPGTKCRQVRGGLEHFRESITDEYACIDAITGIPSMESQYRSVYPATIDTLLAGMRGKDFAYMVVANPIPETDIDGILYQCRDFNGQAESLKSFNYSESTSSTVSKALSQSMATSEGTSESTSRKGKAWALVGAGLTLASIIFPPAGAITTTIALAAAANTGNNLLSQFSPTKTTGTTTQKTHTESETNTYSSQQGQTISTNIVNKQIEAVSEQLQAHSRRFETGKAIGCWSVGVYLFSDNRQELQSASMQLKSIISGQESVFEPIRIHHIEDIVQSVLPQSLGSMDAPIIRVANDAGAYFQHPLGEHFNDLRTVLTTKELSYLINFPLRAVPGISVIDSSPEFSMTPVKKQVNTVEFGRLLYGGTPVDIPYHLSLNDLSKHTLLSGINGSGKTNTVMAILNAVASKMPYLIIEPAKTEYVDWAVEYNKQHPDAPITIYMPGCKSYRDKVTRQIICLAELHLNPFEPIWLDKEQEPNILSHIDRLKSTFAAAFPMYDILPVLMEDLIYSIYQNKSTDWLNVEPQFGVTMPPTLNSMSVGVDKVISSHQYEPRIEQNMKACLNTRIDSLKRGWKGRMLNTVHSTPLNELFERPVIINLSYVGDDVDKGFFMSLILQMLYEYRSACAELGRVDFNDNSCRHLTVIEEAHRVMMKCDNPEMPQYKTAMTFANMLSEVRAYGEGMFLVDQVPTRLIPDAIKNTNTKITHRLVAEDDVNAIAEAKGLSKEQRLIIPKLMVGECLISTSLTPYKYWIRVNKSK